jgi:hypothetical protein
LNELPFWISVGLEDNTNNFLFSDEKWSELAIHFLFILYMKTISEHILARLLYCTSVYFTSTAA